MALTNITTTLIPFISPYLRSCPVPIQKQILMRAAWEWCTATESWRETLPSVTLVSGTADYTPTMPVDTDDGAYAAQIIRLISLKVGTDRYLRASMSDHGVMTICPTPSTGDAGLVAVPRAVLQPTSNNALYPAWFVGRWQQGMIARCLELLFAMKGKPWSDPDSQLAQMKIFLGEAGRAKRELVTERVQGPVMVCIPQL